VPSDRSKRPKRRRLRTVDETSAGGLVVDFDAADEVGLLIAKHDRRGRLVWALPKGHVESGETPEDTAIREVTEETGITGRVIAPLGVIDFWFVADGRRIHKTVHHFLLARESGELCTDDREVTDVGWVPIDDLHGRMVYADERKLLDQLPGLLAEVR
jgi:8-oxo-dGTP pyrophosphatase MutT (NUDIX family)